jgi:hypothetical protein
VSIEQVHICWLSPSPFFMSKSQQITIFAGETQLFKPRLYGCKVEVRTRSTTSATQGKRQRGMRARGFRNHGSTWRRARGIDRTG